MVEILHLVGGVITVAIKDAGFGGVCTLRQQASRALDDHKKHALDRAAVKA